MQDNEEYKIKSIITNAKEDEWWIEKIESELKQVYPKTIKVGEFGKERVYIPERMCIAEVYTYTVQNIECDEQVDAYHCSECCNFLAYVGEEECIDNYCSLCGARIVQ